jgi:signal transduction histidine kinase
VLDERQHLTDDLDQYFSTVSIAGKRIIRTIELILNMSDLKSGSYVNDPKPTDVYNEILKDVYHQLHRYADEKKLQFDLIQKSDSLFVNVDQFATEQSLIQIIGNAIKFTEKGHVTICAEENETGNPVITIEDTGVGIGEEYMKMLYTAFTQEDQGYSRSFEGNGLGLALAKKYCDLNNIQIDVKSEKRKGTIFTLTFLS